MTADQKIVLILSITLLISAIMNTVASFRAGEARADMRHQYESCINDLPFTLGPGDSTYIPPGE